MSQEESGSNFILIGNHPCLDFINTQIIQGRQWVDLLADFTDLVHWLEAVQLLDPATAQAMITRWQNTPEGQSTFELALPFRAILREMVKGIVEGKPPPPATIAEINKWLRARIHYAQLIQTQDGFAMHSCLAFDEGVHLLTPIAEAAGDLLRNADFSLIKKCENPACILYFYDTTKNRARRWCSKHLCGNRMKVAAYYRRHRHKSNVKRNV